MLLKCFVIDFKCEDRSQRIYHHAENRTKAFGFNGTSKTKN